MIKNYYIPPNVSIWQGRADTPLQSSFFQKIKIHNMLVNNIQKTSNKIFALIGFCCDEGVRRNLGRVGAAAGPQSLRRVFAKLPMHKQDFELYDVGDIQCIDGNLEDAQDVLSVMISKLLSQDIIPIVIGGGHEVAWGHYKGIVNAFPKKKLGIVNFDAHFDMRPLLTNNLGSSGTPFFQIATECEKNAKHFDYNCIGIQHTGNISSLFETAKKYQVNTLLAEDVHQNDIHKHSNFIEEIIKKNEIIYTTICLDVFSAGFAPGVSAVQPLGLSPWQVIPFIRALARSGKAVSYDIAELCPAYDTDECTAKLAACLVYEIVHNHSHHQL